MDCVKLKSVDQPTERLLNMIADYVKYPGLRSIATDVGMDEARFSQIQADNNREAKNQIFEVKCDKKFQLMLKIVLLSLHFYQEMFVLTSS